MPADSAERMTLGARLRGWWPVVAVAGLLVVAGVVAIPLGGWDTVELQSRVVPALDVGETYVGNRLATSIDEVYLTDVNPDGYTEPEPGETYLVVVATMENTTAEPQQPLGSESFYALTVPGLVALGEDLEVEYAVYLERDGTFLPTLSPGVADTVQFVLTVPAADYRDGDEIVVGITDANPEEADLYLGTRWVDVHIAVEVTLTVTDRR